MRRAAGARHHTNVLSFFSPRTRARRVGVVDTRCRATFTFTLRARARRYAVAAARCHVYLLRRAVLCVYARGAHVTAQRCCSACGAMLYATTVALPRCYCCCLLLPYYHDTTPVSLRHADIFLMDTTHKTPCLKLSRLRRLCCRCRLLLR